MKIAIIGAATGALAYRLLDNKLNQLIESSQCFLFTVLCGKTINNKNKEETIGELWAKNNGAPIEYIIEKTEDLLIKRLFLKADYIIFILNGNPKINKIFMQYKMLGKHGSVIKINE